MAELTTAGFERRNRTEIISDVTDLFKAQFGTNIATSDDSVFGQFIATISELVLEQEKLQEEVYYAQTKNGAEGIYLDDLFSKFGVYRQGKTAGTGTVHVRYDATTSDSTLIADTATFSASNGITYNVTADTLLKNKVTGSLIASADITGLTYTAALVNTTTGDTENFSHTLPDLTDPSKLLFLNDFKDFILNNTTDNASLVFVDSGEVALYVGYNASKQFVGLTEAIVFDVQPNVGKQYSSVEVEANTVGVNELPIGGVIALTPTFAGYLSSTNISAFFAGTNVETDAAFRIRFENEILASSVGTRDGVVQAVLDIAGVEQVRIYDNPTDVDVTEAAKFTFHTVVNGGTDSVIAQAIYDNKPINVGTSGTTSVSVDTLDGDIEVINFSKAVTNDYNVKLSYKTVGNVPLSTSERALVSTNLVSIFDQFSIGGVVYNTQLVSAFLSALPFSRILTVTVETKLTSAGDGSYTTADITLPFNEVADLASEDIVFNRVV